MKASQEPASQINDETHTNHSACNLGGGYIFLRTSVVYHYEECGNVSENKSDVWKAVIIAVLGNLLTHTHLATGRRPLRVGLLIIAFKLT